MPSPLLSIASGALQGGLDVRAKKKHEADADLAKRLELLNTPGISLEDPSTRGILDVASRVAGSGALGGLGTAPTVQQPTQVGQDAGNVELGGKTLNVRFDPSQTTHGRQLAQDTANRAAHQRLSKKDPTLWNGTYDPGTNYSAAEHDEAKKDATEAALISAGYDKTRARLLSRTGFDPDKRDAELEASRAAVEARKGAAVDRSTRTAESAQTIALRTQQQVEKDAHDTALGWAMNGKRQKIEDSTLQDQIAEGLAPMYPKLTYAQRVGVAARAMMTRDQSTATIGAKDRSGVKAPAKGGLKIPGVKLSNVPMAGGAAAAAAPANSGSAAEAAKKKKPAGDRVKARQDAIDEMVDEGLDAPAIKVELKRRGL